MSGEKAPSESMGGTRGELVPARGSAEREARVGISAEMTARQEYIKK